MLYITNKEYSTKDRLKLIEAFKNYADGVIDDDELDLICEDVESRYKELIWKNKEV